MTHTTLNERLHSSDDCGGMVRVQAAGDRLLLLCQECLEPQRVARAGVGVA